MLGDTSFVSQNYTATNPSKNNSDCQCVLINLGLFFIKMGLALVILDITRSAMIFEIFQNSFS